MPIGLIVLKSWPFSHSCLQPRDAMKVYITSTEIINPQSFHRKLGLLIPNGQGEINNTDLVSVLSLDITTSHWKCGIEKGLIDGFGYRESPVNGTFSL